MCEAIFKVARANAPSLIIIDEVDAILGERTDNSGGETMLQVKSKFLSLWSDLAVNNSKVLLVSTTNRP